MVIHGLADTSVRGFAEVFKTTGIHQYNYIKSSPMAVEFEKLSNDLSTLYYSSKKQINKELLQGRNVPKKLRKWMMEADLLESQVRNILLLGKGLSNSFEDEELVEIGTKIINHLNHCPLVGGLVYKKPINVTRMAEISAVVEISVDKTETESIFSSIFELGNDQISSSGRGNIIEEASSVHGNDVFVTENTPHSLDVSITTVDEKTEIPHSSIQQKAELGTPNENMLISMSGFDPKHEGESSTCSEAQLAPETTFCAGAEEIYVEQTEMESNTSETDTCCGGAEELYVEQTEMESNTSEADSLLSSTKLYLNDTFEDITISVTGAMSKFVDLKLILCTSSSQEKQRLLNSGLMYIDLVPKMDEYQFFVKKKLVNPESLGPLESSLVTNGALIPEHMILNKDICGSNEGAASDKWGQVFVINLIEKNLSSLPDNPNCPNLVLLFLQRNNRLSSIPSSFFQNMPVLCFLDLSYTRIRTLPSSLFTLTRLEVLMLRNCVFLDNIPSEISKLEHMEVLDLSGTELFDLPKEIGQLTRLRHLLLSVYGPDDESEYVHLPSEILCHGFISKLENLQALSIVVHPEDHRWATIASNVGQEVGVLKRLSYLQIYFPEIEDFNLFIERSPSWNHKILKNYKFVVGNDVKRIVSRIPEGLEPNYDQLNQFLRYVNGNEVKVMKKVLARVTSFHLDHHVEIKSLSEFGIHNFKHLIFLVVSECPEVEVILDEEISESAFPKLEHLRIHYLWKLEQIWKTPVFQGSFCSLKYLIVHMCPKLHFILSESMVQCLVNLEELIVEDCEAVTIIIEEGKKKVQHDAVKLPQLRKLILRYLPQLVTLGNDLLLSEDQISVYGCPSLILNLTPKKRKQRKLLSLCTCSVCI